MYYANGPTPAQMLYGIRALGLGARKTESPAHRLGDVSPPAVLLVRLGPEPDAHAVAYLGRDGDTYRIVDPVSGLQVHTQESFENRWDGRAIEVFGPSADAPQP